MKDSRYVHLDKKYLYLPNNENTYDPNTWAHHELRRFNMTYCQLIRGVTGRKYNKNLIKVDDKNLKDRPAMSGMNIFFFIWNLETLGKPKLAESMYYYMISHHIFKLEI